MKLRWYRLDLHVHTCLSPCAGHDMTPANIAMMAALENIQMLAITDHNAAGNSLEAAAALEDMGIYCLYGMEVESREGVHLLCYFPSSFALYLFEQYVQEHLPHRLNKPQVFGHQTIVTANGPTEEFHRLLSQSLSLSVEEVYRRVHDLGGMFVPAHADRRSYGLISMLGGLPSQVEVDGWELEDANAINGKNAVVFRGSDAHELEQLVQPEEHQTYLWAEEPNFEELQKACRHQQGRRVVIGSHEGTFSASSGFGGELPERRSGSSAGSN